jgi:putative phage-type endonuclease
MTRTGGDSMSETTINTRPVGLVGWDDTDDIWRAVRSKGCGASDVASLLGFSNYRSSYRSPWQVWAEKVDHPQAPPYETSEAAELGHALEPWLIRQAEKLIGEQTGQTEHRHYAHPEHPWRRCSPDGCVDGDDQELVQAKTAGLVTGRTHGWTDDTIPLGYELQARWEMHVMGARRSHIVALVAGRGLCLYTLERDLALEADLVSQVDTWWQKHVIGGEAPPLAGRDAAMVAALYPAVARNGVDLDDSEAMRWQRAYLDAHAQIRDLEAAKAAAGTELKALLGDAEIGFVNGRPVAVWAEKRNRVDWERFARDLYAYAVEYDAPEELPADWAEADFLKRAEGYRPAPTRSLTIKE